MKYCFELAQKGKFSTSPNPRVGAVIVHEGKIIGEGYHENYGGPHAEVNAINSVKDKSLLKNASIYINLEPCNHFGKTPPCSQLILDSQIPEVFISNFDPFHEVDGKGIKKLKSNGIRVNLGLYEDEGWEVNKRFFTFHQKKRPYIILKWAQTEDGFISRLASDPNFNDNWITCKNSKELSHSWRAEEDAILVGRVTVQLDNPELTCRYGQGNSPIRMVIDPSLKLDPQERIFEDDGNEVWWINDTIEEQSKRIKKVKVNFAKDPIHELLNRCYDAGIQSLIVEGGTSTLNQFIKK